MMATALQKRTSLGSVSRALLCKSTEDISQEGKCSSSANYWNSKVGQSFTSAAKADSFNSFIAGLKGLLHPHRDTATFGSGLER